MSEKRTIDRLDEVVASTAEIAELLEHIRDKDPKYNREELLTTAINLLDDAHEEAMNAYLGLEGENGTR